MPREHNVTTAKIAYQSLLYAIKNEAKVHITVQKVANSRMYVARSSLMKKSERLESKWDVNNRNLMTALKKLNAIDPQTQKPKEKCEGSPLVVIGRGNGKSGIILHPAQGGNARTIEKALSRYFGAVLGKKGPRVVDGGTVESELSSGLGLEDFVGDSEERALPPSSESDVEHDIADPAEQELIDSKLQRKIEEGVIADPYKDGPEISDAELARTDGALSEKRRRKEEKRQREAEEAERNRAEKLSPEFRTNVAADVSHIVATQFQVNRLTGEKNRATEAAMARMITTGLEQMALATSDEAERQRMIQSRLLGCQLALSFPENMREAQRMANDAKGKRGDPWHNLSEADRKKLDKMIGDHEIFDQHDLVQHLFEMARDLAFELKSRPAGPDGGFWAPYEPNNATPRKFYFFTGAFEAAKDREKLKLLERYILMVRRLTDHPERLVDMLSLDSNGTTLGWDYERDWPPETWWERNRFLRLSPQVALTDKATAATMALITPLMEQASEFKEDLKKQKDGNIFQRVSAAIGERRKKKAPSAQTPADADGTSASDEMPTYRNPLQAVTYNVDKLSEALTDLEPSVDTEDMSAASVELTDLVDRLKNAGFGELLGNIDHAGSEQALADRVEEARLKALEFRKDAKDLAAEESEPLSEDQSKHLDSVIKGLDDMLQVLSDIDRRRILTPAIHALADGYQKTQKSDPADRARHKPLAQIGRAMLPFFTGEYELLLEQILTAEPADRAEAIGDAKAALASAMPNLEHALATPAEDVMGNEDDRRKLDAHRDRILDAMRPGLATALSRVEELERLEAERSRS